VQRIKTRRAPTSWKEMRAEDRHYSTDASRSSRPFTEEGLDWGSSNPIVGTKRAAPPTRTSSRPPQTLAIAKGDTSSSLWPARAAAGDLFYDIT